MHYFVKEYGSYGEKIMLQTTEREAEKVKAYLAGCIRKTFDAPCVIRTRDGEAVKVYLGRRLLRLGELKARGFLK